MSWGFKSGPDLLSCLRDCFVPSWGRADPAGDLLSLSSERERSCRRQMGTFLCVIPGEWKYAGCSCVLAVGQEPPKTLSKSLKRVPVLLILSRRFIWRSYPLPLVLASRVPCTQGMALGSTHGWHCHLLHPHQGRTGAGVGAALLGMEAGSGHGRDPLSSLAGAQHPAAAAGRLVSARVAGREVQGSVLLESPSSASSCPGCVTGWGQCWAAGLWLSLKQRARQFGGFQVFLLASSASHYLLFICLHETHWYC